MFSSHQSQGVVVLAFIIFFFKILETKEKVGWVSEEESGIAKKQERSHALR
jgi:hypothetical protein